MKKTIHYLFAFAAMLALTASLGRAQQCHDEPETKPAKTEVKPTDDTAMKGVVVTIDPKTHQMRQSTPEEIGSLEKARPAGQTNALRTGTAASRRSGIRMLQHHTGAKGVALDDSYMTSMVATKSADGKLAYECVEGAKDGKTEALKVKPAPVVTAPVVTAKKGGAADVR